MKVTDKLKKLRELMKKHTLDAYFITDGDKHSSEYVNDYYKERSYMTSFEGSNGDALIMMDKAYLWTDGRYFLQAEKDLKNTGIELMKMGTPGYPTISEYIKDNLSGKRIGLNGEYVPYGFIVKIGEFSEILSNID